MLIWDPFEWIKIDKLSWSGAKKVLNDLFNIKQMTELKELLDYNKIMYEERDWNIFCQIIPEIDFNSNKVIIENHHVTLDTKLWF